MGMSQIRGKNQGQFKEWVVLREFPYQEGVSYPISVMEESRHD